jgi:hypothetical protein
MTPPIFSNPWMDWFTSTYSEAIKIGIGLLYGIMKFLAVRNPSVESNGIFEWLAKFRPQFRSKNVQPPQ